MAFVTINPRDLRKKVIFTFHMRTFNPSNLGGDLTVEKSCDAIKSSNNMNEITNTINIANKRISQK